MRSEFLGNCTAFSLSEGIICDAEPLDDTKDPVNFLMELEGIMI